MDPVFADSLPRLGESRPELFQLISVCLVEDGRVFRRGCGRNHRPAVCAEPTRMAESLLGRQARAQPRPEIIWRQRVLGALQDEAGTLRIRVGSQDYRPHGSSVA